MDTIEYNLPPFQKERKNNLKEKIYLSRYTKDLFDELSSMDNMDIIERMKKVPQLGPIIVPEEFKKSRYDYMILQLYLYQLIKRKPQPMLKYKFRNVVRPKEFGNSRMPGLIMNDQKMNVGSILQLLTIVYNIGHFFNTFTASTAVVMLVNESPTFKKTLIESSSSARFQESAEKILSRQDYHHLHLLNSLLILERCNQENVSVLWAQEIIYAYINKESLPNESKLRYVFKIFQTIRDVSFIAYDLQVANTPFTYDLWNTEAVKFLFKELLSIYNNQLPSYNLIESIKKMLNDTLYNEDSNTIRYYQISKKMILALKEVPDYEKLNYYTYYWSNEESILNQIYVPDDNFVKELILKLTFRPEEKTITKDLISEIEKVASSKVGYYDRNSGERTVLVSIEKDCTNKKFVAFRILQIAIHFLNEILKILPCDPRYLLISKFFIFYLFSEHQIVIKGTIDDNVCVLCTRGKERIEDLTKLLDNKKGTESQYHEAEFMRTYLKNDMNNDTTIMIPASIIVFKKDNSEQTLCEFDGIIIYPMQNIVTLLEAKKKSSNAKKCLSERLDKLEIEYKKDAILLFGHDAAIQISI